MKDFMNSRLVIAGAMSLFLIFAPETLANSSSNPSASFSPEREDVILKLLSDFDIPAEGGSIAPRLNAIFDDAGYLSEVVFFDRRGYLKYRGELPGMLAIACSDHSNPRSDEYFVIKSGSMIGVALSEFGSHWNVITDSHSRPAAGYRVPSSGSLCKIPRHLSHRYMSETR